MTEDGQNEKKAAELRVLLEQRKPQLEEFKKNAAATDTKWLDEIKNLERRITEEVADIDLGNNTTIAVRMSLTGTETARLNALDKMQETETVPEKRDELASEMIAIITANPLITKEWLMENRNSYSPADVMLVLMGYLEVKAKERIDHVRKLQSAAIFRRKSPGPELRKVPALHEDNRPS